jgi:hypothetical protein
VRWNERNSLADLPVRERVRIEIKFIDGRLSVGQLDLRRKSLTHSGAGAIVWVLGLIDPGGVHRIAHGETAL